MCWERLSCVLSVQEQEQEALLSLCGACLMCNLQEDTISSVLSLPTKYRVWGCIGLVKSVYAHCRGESLGPHPLLSWC